MAVHTGSYLLSCLAYHCGFLFFLSFLPPVSLLQNRVDTKALEKHNYMARQSRTHELHLCHLRGPTPAIIIWCMVGCREMDQRSKSQCQDKGFQYKVIAAKEE